MTDTVRPRIDRYLSETGLAARSAKIVPLTGDASDRRYVRISAEPVFSGIGQVTTFTFVQ